MSDFPNFSDNRSFIQGTEYGGIIDAMALLDGSAPSDVSEAVDHNSKEAIFYGLREGSGVTGMEEPEEGIVHRPVNIEQVRNQAVIASHITSHGYVKELMTGSKQNIQELMTGDRGDEINDLLKDDSGDLVGDLDGDGHINEVDLAIAASGGLESVEFFDRAPLLAKALHDPRFLQPGIPLHDQSHLVKGGRRKHVQDVMMFRANYGSDPSESPEAEANMKGDEKDPENDSSEIKELFAKELMKYIKWLGEGALKDITGKSGGGGPPPPPPGGERIKEEDMSAGDFAKKLREYLKGQGLPDDIIAKIMKKEVSKSV